MVYSGGRYVNYRYNAEGSLAELDYGEGDAAPTATYRFEYDSLGRLIRSQQRDGNTVTQRTEQLYDTANRLSAQGWTIGGTSYRESYAYDASDGSLTTLNTAVGTRIGYNYDALKRLRSRAIYQGSTPLFENRYAYATQSGNQSTALVDFFNYRLASDDGSGDIIVGYQYEYDNGGNITDDACTTATGYVNSPETAAAVQKLVDLYANGEFTGFNSGDIPMTDGFGTGRYMMLLEGPWKTAELAGAYPDFNYGTSEVPAGSAGSISVLGGEDIAMFNTANKEGTWKFMKFMTSEYAQEEMSKCGQIPVNMTALDSQTVKDASFAPFLEAITTAKARPTVASWSEIDNALTVAMTDMIVNGADVQQTLDQLAVTIDGLLAE